MLLRLWLRLLFLLRLLLQLLLQLLLLLILLNRAVKSWRELAEAGEEEPLEEAAVVCRWKNT